MDSQMVKEDFFIYLEVYMMESGKKEKKKEKEKQYIQMEIYMKVIIKMD